MRWSRRWQEEKGTGRVASRDKTAEAPDVATESTGLQRVSAGLGAPGVLTEASHTDPEPGRPPGQGTRL